MVSRGAKAVANRYGELGPLGQHRRSGGESCGRPPKACRRWSPCPGQPLIAPKLADAMWNPYSPLARPPAPPPCHQVRTGERSTYRTCRQELFDECPLAERECRQGPCLSSWQLRIVKRAPQEEPHRRVTIGRHRFAPEERRLDHPLPAQSSVLWNPGNESSAPPGKPCLWFGTPISCRQPIPISRVRQSLERPFFDSVKFCLSNIRDGFSATKLVGSFRDHARSSRLRR